VRRSGSSGGERPSPLILSQRDGGAEGSLSRVVPGRAGAALTKPGRAGTARRCGSGERDGEEYARNRCETPPLCGTGSNLADLGRERRAPALHDGRGTPAAVGMSCRGGCEEGLRRTRSEAAGAEPGSSFGKRIALNTGTVPGLPGCRASGAAGGLGTPSAERPGAGRSRRSTPSRGEPGAWGRAAAVTRRTGGCNAGRRTAEWRCSASRTCRVLDEGIGDAGQASPLGGGRSRPPVR